MNAREYENHVAKAVGQIAEFSSAKIFRNKRFEGVRQPGQYEIDVSLEVPSRSTEPIIMIIECKNLRRPIGRPIVQKLVQTRDAISAHIPVLVSPVGFTKEAIQVARAFGVTLWILAETDSSPRIVNVTEGRGPVRSLVQEFFVVERDVSCQIQEYPEPIIIKNILQMYLQSYTNYKGAGSPELNVWIEQNLELVIREVLFSKRYVDLLIGFERFEREIMDRLTVRARTIGYTIKQFIAVPDFEPYEWLKPFDIEVESTFETRISGFQVKLGLVVTTRIRRLQDIESYLNRQQNVPELMKENTVNEARQVLHTIDPERFYMRFSYTDEPGEESVEKVLTDRITNCLREKFNADVISVVFKMLDTEITEIWSKLEKSEGNLEIHLMSPSDVEEVIYRGRIRVAAIHSGGWNRFGTANPDIGIICRRMEEYVQAQLGPFASADLVYTNLEQQRQVERIVEGLAKKFALEEFGLIIRVNNIRRDITQLEAIEARRLSSILDVLEDLAKQRMHEITNRVSSDSIKIIEDRIQYLESELPVKLPSVVDPLGYEILRLRCLADVMGYEPRPIVSYDRPSSFTLGTPVYEISNLVLTYLSKDTGAHSIISQWKSDQKKRLEKHHLPEELLESLLQAVIAGDEDQYDAVRVQLPPLGS